MADLPIIFSAPMVRALLDGRKTQTRRVLKDRLGVAGNRGAAEDLVRYAVGDRLWVREAVTWVSAWGWRYRADNDDLTEKRAAGEVSKLTPSIHMPRRASRITLTVTDVRVQRLQDCSEADARAEGVVHNNAVRIDAPLPLWSVPGSSAGGRSPREAYATLWDEINGPGAWAQNPWVAAYTFTVARGNIDQLGAR